ncbi:hypothetical protein GCM10018779_24530 [Streptomyces griseocarneus]|nr:hypothetical protein GCM10018779_24530 [Streptomyces griseocarneus]
MIGTAIPPGTGTPGGVGAPVAASAALSPGARGRAGPAAAPAGREQNFPLVTVFAVNAPV